MTPDDLDPDRLDSITQEQLAELVMNVMELYAEVLENGSEMEKIVAKRAFDDALELIQTRLARFSERKGLDFRDLDDVINNDPTEFGRKMRDLREKIQETAEEAQTKISKLASPTPKKKKGKKNKRLENGFKAKDG